MHRPAPSTHRNRRRSGPADRVAGGGRFVVRVVERAISCWAFVNFLPRDCRLPLRGASFACFRAIAHP
eukprot:6588259-Pyramimonas_sp.AAC.1